MPKSVSYDARKVLGCLVLLIASFGLCVDAAETYEVSKAPIDPARAAGIKCVESMCGPSEKNNRHIDSSIRRIGDFAILKSKDKNAVIYPPNTISIARKLERLNEEKLGVLKEAAAKIDLKSNRSLEGVGRNIYNALFFGSHASKVKLKIIPNPPGYEIDEAATAKSLRGLSPADRKWVADTFLKFAVQGKSLISQQDLENKPIVENLMRLYPNMSLEDAIAKLQAENLSILSGIRDKSSFEKAIFFGHSSEDQLVNLVKQPPKNLTETEVRSLITWNQDAARGLTLISPDSPFATRKTPALREISARIGGLESITSRLLIAAKVSKDSKELSGCEMTYFLNDGLLPSDPEKKRAEKEIEETKTALMTLVKMRFPESAWSRLLPVIEKSQFILPPTRDEFRKDFNEKLSNRSRSMEVSNKLIKSGARSIQDLVIAMASNSKPIETSSESSVNTLCDGFKYEPLSDANYTATGTVMLSYPIVRASASDRQFVVAHEIGHSMFRAIQLDPELKKMFEPVRRCLANMHVEPMPAGTAQLSRIESPNRAKEGPYVNEDFADALGYELRSLRAELSSPRQASAIPWCAYLERGHDGDYSDVSLQSNEFDPHSSNLLRALVADAPFSGKLTPACDRYFKPHNIEGRFKRCLTQMSSAGSATGQPTVQ